MSPLLVASQVVHPGLDPAVPAVPLDQARLTDRQKLTLVLQAAGLLSLLERAGWTLVGDLAVTPDGRLGVRPEAIVPGGASRPAQEVLRDLLRRLFRTAGPERARVAGRGEGRRAARALNETWGQSLAPVPADEAVVDVLDAAPFLWGDAFAAARRALAGEIHLWTAGETRVRPWVAGPAVFRRLLLARSAAAGIAPGDLLASRQARRIWDREEEGDPRELAAAGRYRAAVAAWERQPPASEAERIERARVLIALGRFEAALGALSGPRGGTGAAGVVRLRCQLLLGELGAARAALRGLEEADLPAGATVELADLAVRLLSNQGEPERVGAWVDRALQAGGEQEGTALAARLVAAAAAWDRRDPAAMDRCLAEARAAESRPDLAWRYHHARALRAMLDSDGPAVVEQVARAIRASRRRLARHEAAGLWNELGIGRVQAGDLAGAERAFLHSLRLFGGCDGPRKTTLALHNLAEVRLRRGRLHGVREILERSAARNRLSGNVRGLTQDMELWIRFELMQGRAGAALTLYGETVAELDRQGIDWRRAELAVLAARALGWLRRPAEAAAHLALATREALLEQLEPEERPALQAQAGDWEGALGEAAGTPFAPLWRAAAAGEAPPAPAWEALDGLEPYRAARLVFDLEILVPGAAPADRLRQAAAELRALGALPLAQRLEESDQSPWQALAAYCGQPPGNAAALTALLAGAGHPEARLVWREREEGGGKVIVAGAGGEPPGPELVVPLEEGWLALRGAPLDAVLRALFALAVRDLGGDRQMDCLAADPPEPSPAAAALPEAVEARRSGRRPAEGLVGESPALLAALERAARLAAGDMAILVLGESGTGKELVARHIHRASPRARLPFVAVNCAALSDTLLLSDLFGHVRGAFTGADRDRAGVFEAAQGGTVFLDEIGDLPMVAQGMLLRVLQEGEVRRVGESLPRKVNVRVVAATHRDLRAMIGAQSFREDLYYRLRGGLVELPPLRDRGDDILLLADSILSRLRMPHAPRLSREARASLLSYPWPGNVRELQNVLGVAAALAGGDRIRPEHLDLPAPRNAAITPYHQSVEAFRRRLIEEAMTASGGSLSEAARRLGLSRQALSYLVKQLGLK